MKKGNWIAVGIIVIAIIIGALIISSNLSKPEQPQCSSDYYWTGSECCYDIDSNGICDKDQNVFEFVFDNCPIHSWGECVKPCENKCAELGLRIAVSAVDGSELASHPGPNDKFYCNCVRN